MPTKRKAKSSTTSAKPSTKPGREVVISLDLGTKTGFSVRHNGELIESGTWNQTPRTKRKKNPQRRGHRWQGFLANLKTLRECYGLDPNDTVVFCYEVVHRHTGVIAAHVYGGFLAVLELTEVMWGIEWLPIEIGHWKEVCTGHSNADKELYIEAANKREHLNLEARDEDAAAAIGIGICCDKRIFKRRYKNADSLLLSIREFRERLASKRAKRKRRRARGVGKTRKVPK